MLSITYDGFKAYAYVDGVSVGSAGSYTTKTPIFYNMATSMFIGGEATNNQTTPSNLFNGKVQDLSIYATALSADDVYNLYKYNRL